LQEIEMRPLTSRQELPAWRAKSFRLSFHALHKTVKMKQFVTVFGLALVLVSALPVRGQVILHPPYATHYSLADLGAASDVPGPYGGMTFKADDPNTLLIAGGANTAGGQLFAVSVVRDLDGHITAFTGAARFFADAPNNDGGVAYGPGGVLFLARYPNNEIGQLKPGHIATDRVIDLALHEVTASPGGLNFVPPGWPNAGRLLISGYGDGQFYSVGLKADALGTYSVTNVTAQTQIDSGPEGFIFVPPGSVLFSNYNSMLVCHYGAGEIQAYQLTTNSAPRPETKSVFISGLSGAEGAVIDPVSGDFIFSTFGGGDHLVAVRGFNRPPTVSVASPTNNATWRCCLPNSLAAVASDDGPVKKLELLVNGTLVAEGVGTSLAVPWETNRPGTYSVTARATDSGGLMSTSSPVTLNIVAPALNTLVPAGFTPKRSFHLCGSGETNLNYFMEAATIPNAWTTLGPMIRTNGILEYYDAGASNRTYRFYRMRR
jgi:hypothetical protein